MNCDEMVVRLDRRPTSPFIVRIGRPLHLEGHPMDDSNLFSHLETPKYVASVETCAKPVEYPMFSDRPGSDAVIAAKQ
jgi:hypothetical protein